RTAPDGPESTDWAWADARLGRLRELGISPIVGLVHHGSGPRETSLVDPAFPEKLAAYARRVAERYPWIEAWTPVNEPLTTARFSGLYGLWYPHGRDDLTFAHTLLNQCRAIVLAMRAVRETNPRAQLVQTEDLGKTYSTPLLAYQAKFENERRWLTFDLLCGRVRPGHRMWKYFRWRGITAAALWWHVEHPCPPDVVGINHYLTSERFLDERLLRYPARVYGGNRRHRYADVEAVRVLTEGIAGPRVLLREAWERYRLPLAITECHLGCTREEQMRWLKEVWDAAHSLKCEGVDVRAVTAWSLLGAFGWDCLLTRDAGCYEPGVFDLRRTPAPRPTALARMLRALSAGDDFAHPALDTPGWWRRLERLQYHPPDAPTPHHHQYAPQEVHMTSPGFNLRGEETRPVLITGATGTLGRAFARVCEQRGLPYRLLSRGELDIAAPASVEAAFAAYRPWAVVNAAGYVRVDEAERDTERCFRENAAGPRALAEACVRRGAAFVTFSSDLVFDGRKDSPYVERDATAPLNVYGASKAEAERLVLEAMPSALVVRTGAFFGPWDQYNFVLAALRALDAGRPFRAADDAVVSPTYVPDLVHACLDLLIDGEGGLWHLANRGALTWADLARASAEAAGLDQRLVEGCPADSLGLTAPRPRRTALASERGPDLLPALDDALARYARDCELSWATDRFDQPRVGVR
ncbi:MAG: sugar nucleotide-binding protein, partial [Pyrinomonadaceae bacterium]